MIIGGLERNKIMEQSDKLHTRETLRTPNGLFR